MLLSPQEIAGESIAIFIHDVDGDCGGSSVLFGIARFEDGSFFVERQKKPLKFLIPESAWNSIRENDTKEKGSTFEDVSYIVRLRLGKMPEGKSTEAFEKIDAEYPLQ